MENNITKVEYDSFKEDLFLKHVLPPIPFFKIKNDITIQESEFPEGSAIWQADAPLSAEQQYFPLSFKNKTDKVAYTLPYEPMISIEGGNTIIRRYLAKPKPGMVGSIKERWNQKDYKITIRGFLIGSLLTGSVQQCYPIRDFAKLKEYLTTAESIQVFCEPLNLLNILELVIEDFSFPFTKGENVQAYEITAYSNLPQQILIDIIDKQNPS